jgi:hypothetical protein
MKQTKEKWVAHQIEETGEFAIFSLNTFIAQTENPMINEEPTKSEKQANANLIASAPEMLEALKNAEGVVRLASPSMAGKIKELVDKAEGK